MAKTLVVKVGTVVDEEMAAELRALAVREGSSEYRILRLALRDYLAQRRAEEEA